MAIYVVTCHDFQQLTCVSAMRCEHYFALAMHANIRVVSARDEFKASRLHALEAGKNSYGVGVPRAR